MGAASNCTGQGRGWVRRGLRKVVVCAGRAGWRQSSNLRVSEHIGVKDIEFGGGFDWPHDVAVYVFDALDNDLVSPLGLGERRHRARVAYNKQEAGFPFLLVLSAYRGKLTRVVPGTANWRPLSVPVRPVIR